ncbi:putative dehydrogenase [Rhizobium herbae]|uniref:Dehydrogenase n=1 Tax=Rhizobium herbae TaxID=508661 RepID=A0ABS4EUN5_9HYPH|nr:putative dehydrogenase [Rhizobium herbae]
MVFQQFNLFPHLTVLENCTLAQTLVSRKPQPEFFFLERYMRAYSAEWAAFVDAVNSGSALPVTLDDGVNALAVAEAATRSAKSGQTVSLASI